jgi:hypothetical protein
MTDFPVPLNYFTKRARELQVGVRACESAAIERVRCIFTDAVNRTDHEVAGDFGLMRAQHVVAVEHGFANWKALADASGIEARLAITMAKHPELNDFGIGLLNGGRNLSTEEKSAKNAADRRVLRGNAAAVARTVTWLHENVAPTRSINPHHTSYSIKAIAEEDIGYISNGVMIAAGIIVEYPYEIVANSPNVAFGISEKSLTEIATRRHSPERVLRRFTPRAIEVLAKRGVQAFPVGRSGVELAWLDDGDVRTLRIGTIETTPFIVRLYVDHYEMLISRKVAKALGVAGGHYAQACPGRPKGEISVLLDEVDAALEWALNYDARSGSQQPPPFESQGFDGWSFVWSIRASERSSARRKGSADHRPRPITSV